MQRIHTLLMRWGHRGMAWAVIGWVIALAGMLAGLWRVRGPWVLYILITVLAAVAVILYTNHLRERFVREAALPQFLQRKLRETYPHLSPKDCELAERGLCQFFIACMRSRKQFVAMPSKTVDTIWHAFILHTQAYKAWCESALGFFLHHTPA